MLLKAVLRFPRARLIIGSMIGKGVLDAFLLMFPL